MAASFEAYIDECGCEGFQFAPNASSTWFVLAAVVVRKPNSGRLVTLLDEVRAATGITGRKGVHFRKLRPEHKRMYLEKIAAAPVRVVVVAVHKPKLDQQIFKGGCRLYFYATKFLIERLSWLARDNGAGAGDGTLELTFSQRKTLPYADLEAYLTKLYDERHHNASIDWTALQPKRFHVLEHNKRAGLQIADACAHSAWRRLEVPRAIEHARLLRPVLYRHQTKLRGYGLKVWPPAAERLLTDTEVA